jgi:hypothetical protein
MQNALPANKRSSCFKKWLMISAMSSLLITRHALTSEEFDWTGFHLAQGVGFGDAAERSRLSAQTVTTSIIWSFLRSTGC